MILIRLSNDFFTRYMCLPWLFPCVLLKQHTTGDSSSKRNLDSDDETTIEDEEQNGGIDETGEAMIAARFFLMQ